MKNMIAERRRMAGRTQKEIAERLCVDNSTVGKWESGKAMPRADKLPFLAQLLGCTIDELFEGEGEQKT